MDLENKKESGPPHNTEAECWGAFRAVLPVH